MPEWIAYHCPILSSTKILSNSKMLLKLAFLSLTESMRKDPDKYGALIYHNRPSITQSRDYSSGQYYDAASYIHGQLQYPSQDYPIESYTNMLIEEAEKLYDKLAKELVEEIITDYAPSTSSLLSLLPRPEERQGHPTSAANQCHMDTYTAGQTTPCEHVDSTTGCTK